MTPIQENVFLILAPLSMSSAWPTDALSKQVESVSLRMPAKVNLHLGVHVGRNARGYHQVDTVMIPVGIYDTITVGPAQTLQVSYDPDITLEASQSVLFRTIQSFADALGKSPQLSISVSRGIPSQGGLGSASADTAAAILACCQLWNVDPYHAAVQHCVRSAGADVAFFMNPSPSYYVGIGNDLIASYPQLHAPLVIVKPKAHIRTPAAYAEFDRLPSACTTPHTMCHALAAGDLEGIAANLQNNLTDAAIRLAPAIGDTLTWMQHQVGVMGAQMTGSGSCIFAICESDTHAQHIETAAQNAGLWAKATSSCASMQLMDSSEIDL